MLDALFILIGILFFAAAAAYVRGCERLLPRSARQTKSAWWPSIRSSASQWRRRCSCIWPTRCWGRRSS